MKSIKCSRCPPEMECDYLLVLPLVLGLSLKPEKLTNLLSKHKKDSDILKITRSLVSFLYSMG